ncbi:MAG: tRNA (adenosine(37)-N6)-threonylcarbamoyltransferase complex ATPase subunit type 1 TsaE [Pirellulales bacterium]|nr:tRNA (adenosine(37)-N6)-threonylcarbamoyltransferase complex ATPase subunit type 1 TsaE [Pirellulales bacterium]
MLLPDEAATFDFGKQLAARLFPGAVIALDGPLGAGKTRLVQGIAAGVGIDPATVTSPTFTLVQEYPLPPDQQAARGIGKIFHLDAYRVNSPEEFWELGIEEMFASSNWTIIEWASRVRMCLPREYLGVEILHCGKNERKVISTNGWIIF